MEELVKNISLWVINRRGCLHNFVAGLKDCVILIGLFWFVLPGGPIDSSYYSSVFFRIIR